MDPDYSLFARIVEAGSLSAAGRALGLSPAMVSKRLARLETRLGVTLVNRTTRRLALTELGARFHEDVVAILAAMRAAEERLTGGLEIARAPLRVSAPTSFGRLHVAPHLKRFLDACPGVELELNLSDAFDDLLDAKIDVAIRITPRLGPGLVARRLATSRRILCAAPAYVEAHGAPVSIAGLRGHRLLAAAGQMPWRLAGPGGRVVLVDGESHVRTNSSELVRELAVAGVGVALRSLWDISRDLAVGRLVRVLPDHEGSADVGIYAVSPKLPRPLPAATAFTEFLATVHAPVPAWERESQT